MIHADRTEDENLPEIITLNLPCPSTVSVTFPAVHMCPFKEEVDEGEVTIRWQVVETTVELHSLKAWLDYFDEWFTSHEAYTHHIRETLTALGVHVESVVSRWDTADGQVEVTA